MKHRDEEGLLNFWPGFTDALLSVVLVLIFVVTIFVVTQTSLVSLLDIKEDALARLNKQLELLEEELNLTSLEMQRHKKRSAMMERAMETAMQLLSETREDFTRTAEELNKAKSSLSIREENLEKMSADLTGTLNRLNQVQETNEERAAQLQASSRQIELLSQRVKEYLEQVKILNQQLSTTKEHMAEKDVRLNSLNDAIERLNMRVQELSAQLQEAEKEVTQKRMKLTQLLHEIEERDQEIARLRQFQKYRSEFLAQLAHVFEGVNDIKVVGDRFVFQGEVLFDSGQAVLRPDGKSLLDRFVSTFLQLQGKIPPDSGLNIQIQGHTDTDPISNARFASNWELSTARATEVVKYLIQKGIPSTRLSAAGFSEFFPAVAGKDEASKRQNRRIEIFFTRR